MHSNIVRLLKTLSSVRKVETLEFVAVSHIVLVLKHVVMLWLMSLAVVFDCPDLCKSGGGEGKNPHIKWEHQ